MLIGKPLMLAMSVFLLLGDHFHQLKWEGLPFFSCFKIAGNESHRVFRVRACDSASWRLRGKKRDL